MLRRGRSPGECSIRSHLCEPGGIDAQGYLVPSGTPCAPGADTCGLGGLCVPNPLGDEQMCDYAWEVVSCGGEGRFCYDPDGPPPMTIFSPVNLRLASCVFQKIMALNVDQRAAGGAVQMMGTASTHTAYLVIKTPIALIRMKCA